MDQQPKTNTDVDDPTDLNAQSEIQISKVPTEYGLNKERHACLKCKQCAIAQQAKSAAFPSGYSYLGLQNSIIFINAKQYTLHVE